MDNVEKVLDAFKAQSAPVGAKKIAEATGLDPKEVDKAMKVLKDKGAIISPKRCVWEAVK